MKGLKACVAGAGLSLLAACSSGGNSYSQYYDLLRASFRNGLTHRTITLKEAGAIPYASMGWRLNGGDENLIVLATDNGNEQLWTSAARVVLVTQDGRVKRTVGLEHDLTALYAKSGTMLLAPGTALQRNYWDQRNADFQNTDLFGITIDCSVRRSGPVKIAILGKQIPTVQVNENCVSDYRNWRFQNKYWVDASTGFVWRTIQAISPYGDSIETEIFRPPG